MHANIAEQKTAMARTLDCSTMRLILDLGGSVENGKIFVCGERVQTYKHPLAQHLLPT